MSVISRAECRFSFGADLRFVLLRLKNRSEHNGKSFGLWGLSSVTWKRAERCRFHPSGS